MRQYQPLLFILASSLASGALLPRQECADTVWVTETPAAVTSSTYTNLDVFYTTSTVTAYALLPPTTASLQSTLPITTGVADQLARRTSVPCEAAITSTTTAPTPTTTLTTTYTFSRAARVTAYVQACNASTNYGLKRGTIVVNNRYQSFQSRDINTTDISAADCCMSCFTGSAGCLSWGFNDGCSMSIVDDGCPRGDAATEALWYPGEERSFIGQGPCLKEVTYFAEG
ncbi:hypothetical protein BDZ85DRAFT_280898 [Elsinoe ampelina]|uniref:Apple domain-containing protein n=1 Tax=Elsinoe ampelina TaxID=302913 RepID=A0A6A6GF40_9PEZI|nr:hypothetical protein BDZ85DRAFT_280898 [Elsinoe ampelina]